MVFSWEAAPVHQESGVSSALRWKVAAEQRAQEVTEAQQVFVRLSYQVVYFVDLLASTPSDVRVQQLSASLVGDSYGGPFSAEMIFQQRLQSLLKD